MKEIKKDRDVTWLVNIILVAGLTFLLCGNMFSGCTTSKSEGETAEYWKQMYLQEKKECLLWRNIAHQYWQYLDYDDKENHLGHGNFFDDCISEGDTYDQLNELLDGDWEDFFEMWDNHHEEINF